VTHPDLDELVRQARRDRPAPSLLTSVARNLRVPFMVAPLAALVVPSTATAATTAATLLKAGLGRVTLFGWGAGSAVAASGVAAAVYLSQPAPAPVAPAPAKAEPQSVAPVAKAVEPAPEPEAPANAEKRPVKDAVATWDEPQLIERARRALGSDPRRALQLAQEHQRRFPSGALSVEREVIVLDALARSGQSAEALRRARAFEARYPKSIHTPRVRALRTKLEGS
jgi:hypothetical protein